MTNYYKYLPTSPEDEKWGLYVLNAGFNSINSHDVYPAPSHPAHHYFSWENGRVLNEFQIIYISKGKGVFESENYPSAIINEGSILLLFPGQWHRFKPNQETGWDEHWVGCNGSFIQNLALNGFIAPQNQVQYIGLHENIVSLFERIIRITKAEKTGYQPLVSGVVSHLLGQIHAINKESVFEKEGPTESIINKARTILRANINQDLSMEKLADELNVGYAWFRKAFKTYTGIAPNQYLLQLKIENAKSLLSDKKRSVKEIAFELNFESVFYFSKLFKEKTGLSPEHYRKSLQ